MSSQAANEKILEFSLNRGVYADHNLFIPIPNEYKKADYSFLSDYADSVVIVPKNHPFGTYPADAELALIFQNQAISCGTMYNPEKQKIYMELFTEFYSVFRNETKINSREISEGCGVLYQISSGTDPVVWCKCHGIIFVQTNAYIFHLISNQKTESQYLDPAAFSNLAMQWLEKMIPPEENRSQGFIERKRSNAEILTGDHQENKAENSTEQAFSVPEPACQDDLARRRKETEVLKSRYHDLLQERQEQEQIVAQNRGWFGAQAKRRKAAKIRIQEINAQLAREFPQGAP